MPLEQTHRYDDIIGSPHHQSTRHPHMSRRNRAAQFMPFAALSGYDAVIAEAGRETQRRITLDADELAQLNVKIQSIWHQGGNRRILITYFRKDPVKDGGSYVTVNGMVKRFDDELHAIVLADGVSIPLADIIDVDDPTT